jgi:hypothetical protein
MNDQYLNKLLKFYFNENEIYDHSKFRIKILSLIEQLKDLFKKSCQRYRIIILIYLYQNLDQSISILSKYLFNQNKDYFYQFHFQQTNFAIFFNIFFISKE